LPPNPFGSYELLEVIGRGGMGTVYKARQVVLDVVDAVKVMSSRCLRHPALRRRFLDEMQTQVRLKHPNIVQVRDAGEFHDEPYFAMVYESGGDLAGLIQEHGPPSPERAADLVRQVAEAVAYGHAHDKKIIHCDLKPHNILLSAEGTPKVTDFGLALLLARPEDGGPAAGEPVGTPSYMPPEQARGRLDEVGPWSDVYGLGAVLYELLTGYPPFRGSVAEVLRQVKEDEPRRPRAVNPRVPRRLEAICLRCLQKDPRRRYATAREVAGALDGFLRPWWKRRWREAGVAAAGVLLAVGLLWAGWRAYRAPRDTAYAAVRSAEAYRQQGDRRRALEHYSLAKNQFGGLVNSPWPWPDRPTLRYRLAQVLTALGELYEDAREPREAEASLEEARAQLAALPTGDGRHPEYTPCLAEVHHNLGNLFANRNVWDRAQDHYQQSLELRQRLVAADPRDPVYRRDLARSYGYLGDAQLALGAFAEALNSYQEAEKLRAQLATEHADDVEALCLHARDFGNMGDYYDRLGQPEKAAESYRRRLTYYREKVEPLCDRLPGEYQTERADTALGLAELELDRPGVPPEEVAGLLRQARAEYTQLLNGEPDDAAPPPLVAGLAEIHVAWGKYHHFQERHDAAANELKAAQRLFESLDNRNKARTDDYYYWAVTYALQGERAQGAERAGAQARAVDKLKMSVRNGFNQLARLERDRSFAGLKQARPQEFNDIVKGIRDRRKAP
jgi:tetratricopeptide (TPR) repeat protein